ncbi:uncharacterized protein LOC144432460 [Styela clava]
MSSFVTYESEENIEPSDSEERRTLRPCQDDVDGDTQTTHRHPNLILSPNKRKDGRAFNFVKDTQDKDNPLTVAKVVESPDPPDILREKCHTKVQNDINDHPETKHSSGLSLQLFENESPGKETLFTESQNECEGSPETPRYQNDDQEIPEDQHRNQEVLRGKTQDQGTPTKDPNQDQEIPKGQSGKEEIMNSEKETKFHSDSQNEGNDVLKMIDDKDGNQTDMDVKSTASSTPLSVSKMEQSNDTLKLMPPKFQNIKSPEKMENCENKKIKLHDGERHVKNSQNSPPKFEIPTNKNENFGISSKPAQKFVSMIKIKHKLHRINRTRKNGKRHVHVMIFSEPRINLEKRQKTAKNSLEREVKRLQKCKNKRRLCLCSINHALLNSEKIKQIIRELNKQFPTHYSSAIIHQKLWPQELFILKKNVKTVNSVSKSGHPDCVNTSQPIIFSEKWGKLSLAPPEWPIDAHNRSTQRQYQQYCQVVSDGRVSDDARDPPGQQSIYIPPGDNRLEQYRLSTFGHFPVTCPTSRKSLAKSGFYFTGFYDRVKCFACGRTVERWNDTDNASDIRWHKESCPFPRGEDCGNVPIRNLFSGINISGGRFTAASSSGQTEQVLQQRDPTTGAITRTVRFPADLPERVGQQGGTFQIGPNNTIHIQNGPSTTRGRLPGVQQAPMPPNQWRMANVISSDHRRFLTNLHLNRELDRLASFARWPVGRPSVSPAALARTGFFYLGDMDRTQCFSCGGVLRNWTLEDDAMAEHRSHFPNCKMVLGTEQRNYKVNEFPDPPADCARDYPCRFPSNPHMRNEVARQDTFDRRWPVGRTAATPAEISQAGFFFLGERDRVKCWYCNGGFQNWEYDDMPWIEHAKWFPTCQFLLQVKGQHFVYRHLTMNAHLARPIIAKQDGASVDPTGGNAGGAGGSGQGNVAIPPGGPADRQPEPTPEIIDPQAGMRKRKERVKNIMENSDLVKSILLMRFDEKIVAALLENKIESGNVANPDDIYDSMLSLLDDVMKKGNELKEEESQMQATAQIPAVMNVGGATSMAFPSHSSGTHRGSIQRKWTAEQYGTTVDPSDIAGAGGSGQGNVDIPPSGPVDRQPEPTPEIIDPQVAALLDDEIVSGNIANPDDIYDSMSSLFDDVMKKKLEIKEEECQMQAAAQIPAVRNVDGATDSSENQMESQLSAEELLIKENKEVKEQQHKLKEQQDELKKQQHKLKQQQDELKKQQHKLKEQQDELKKQQHKLKEQQDELKKQQDKLKKKQDDSEKQQDELKEQRDELKEQQDELKKQQDELKKQQDELKEQQDELKEQQEKLDLQKTDTMCKVCFSAPVEMVFLPCLHSACCLVCGERIRYGPVRDQKCPVCRAKIGNAHKFYLS